MAAKEIVYLIRGDDPSIISRELSGLLSELVGDGDRSLLVEELSEGDYEDAEGNYRLDSLINAAQTIPFLTESRIVVGRDLGRFTKSDDVHNLLAYLDNPLPTTSLILVWNKGPKLQRLGQIPKKLLESVMLFGTVIDARVGRKTSEWITEQAAKSGLNLDRAAVSLINETVGEEISRVPAILETLLSVFGAESHIGTNELQPYLGDLGDVPPWELTDSISKGNPALALRTLQRMQSSGGRHQMQIMGFLQSHYSRILRVSGLAISNAKEAAEVLGDKSSFRSKKTLQESQKLGDEKCRKAITLLSKADLDLKGTSGAPPEIVMEILVARLANLYRS
ncbi:MAG: DNA polymerase III subunit delta [Actinomycetota bacterium]|nr:DNA polymerase III subunit delta [Actinomycetota bacterium]